jgi:hypothetical protein
LNDIKYGPNSSDIVLLIVIVAMSIGLIFFINDHSEAGGKKALVYQGNKLVETVGLADKHDRTFKLGATQIEVKDGAIRIAESDCPRGICSHKGWICNSRETIICVPKKIMIEIKDDSHTSEYNAISY